MPPKMAAKRPASEVLRESEYFCPDTKVWTIDAVNEEGVCELTPVDCLLKIRREKDFLPVFEAVSDPSEHNQGICTDKETSLTSLETYLPDAIQQNAVSDVMQRNIIKTSTLHQNLFESDLEQLDLESSDFVQQNVLTSVDAKQNDVVQQVVLMSDVVGQDDIMQQNVFTSDVEPNTIDETVLINFNKTALTVKNKKFSGWTENRHKFKFLEEWYTEFPFIGYDKDKNVMYCQICRKFINDYRKTSVFVIGSDNFRVSMIKYHQRSSMHTECQKLTDALIAEDSKALEKDLYKDQLTHVFKSAYFIFKNKMPYSSFPQLCDSLKKEGTDFSVYSTRDKACPQFGKFIAIAYEKELAQKLANVSEFSLIIDASFKRQIESHDLVYIKYIDGMIIKTVFLGVIDSSAKLHDSIYNILTGLFKRYCIDKWFDKVVYIMTDKSDNHMWLEGLIDIMDNMALPNFISEVKYLPHKVRFCANVVQSYKSTSTIDALLYSVYCYYEKVDIRKKNLIHMNKVLEDIVELYGNLPKNSFITLYYEALKAVEQDWVNLVSLLSDEQQLLSFDFGVRKSGKRILHVITRSNFICKMAMLLDIFSCLNDFAIKLGSEGLMPFDIHILLEEVSSEIEKAAAGEGALTTQISEELSDYFGFFRDIEITHDSNITHIQVEMKRFSHDLICYLKSVIDDTLLEKSFIFNVSLWPEDEELITFGNTEFIDIFLCFKGKEKHVEPALEEWCSFKTNLSALFPFEVKQDSKSVITKMVAEYESRFPFVTSVLKKILLLDFQTDEIQRGYHEMCLNKSHYRSVLSVQSLQTMMMINMYGPSLGEFDCTLALDFFVNSRHRQFRKRIIDRKIGSYLTDHEEDEDEIKT